MNEAEFLRRREPDWQRLAGLLGRADVSPASLNPAEFREFVKLYRRVSTDLAIVRTRSTNLDLIEFLNGLAGRAYSVLYQQPRPSFRGAIANRVATAARTVRRCRWYLLVSFLIFIGSAFGAAALVSRAPESREFLVPPGWEEVVDHWKNGPMDERTSSESAQMTGFYASNNPMAAIGTASIAASTFGLGTAAMVSQNGALLGVLGREMASVGKLDHLLISISPHGVPEMSGLFISGAAGLVMGWALINPGRRSRGEALRAAGKDAIVLLATSVVMMFIAAPIEGFFSFNPRVPDGIKIAVALISAVCWFFFWTGYAREDKPSRP